MVRILFLFLFISLSKFLSPFLALQLAFVLSASLLISRLLISPDADTAVIKSELTKFFDKKFKEFDSADEGVLQPASMVKLALTIKVSLARLQLVEDQPIARAQFVNACTRHIWDRGTVRNLSKHAIAKAVGLSSLSSLGNTYRLVQDQRSKASETIKIFESLVDMLNRHCASQRVANTKVDVQIIDEAQQKAAEQHEDLRRSQQAIQDEVAKIVQSNNNKVIQSMEALPKEVKQTIGHRDIMRSNHVQHLRAIQKDLLQMAIEASQYLLSTVITSISDLEENVLGPMRPREELLKSARDTARAGMVLYNSGKCSEHGPMGACVPLTSPRDEAIFKVLACYDKWVSTYLTTVHAKETDADTVESSTGQRHRCSCGACV